MKQPEGENLRQRMHLYLKNKYRGVLAPSWSARQMLATAYSFKEAEKQLREIEKYVQLDKEMRILDAGCGFGHFVSYLLARKYNCCGYEVEPKLAKIAKSLLSKNKQDPRRIRLTTGSRLPYKNKSFDLINLHFVLDYVENIPQFLKELKRILADDGHIFIIVPNYQCCYSPVYAMFFIPWLPRFVNRVYFKLMGRPNTKFLEGLTFTTPKYQEKVFRDCGFEFTNLGLRHWQETISGRNLANRSNFLKLLIRQAHRLRLTWFLELVGEMGFYTPLVYILKKEKNEKKKSKV